MDFQITPIQNPNIEPVVQRSFFAVHKGKLVAGVVFLAAITAFVYYFYFLNRTAFSENQVSLNIDGLSEITSGELVSYKVEYVNNSKVAITDVQIDFMYPVDSIPIKDGELSNSINENIKVGHLPSGAKGEKIFSAYIVGDRGNIKTARATIAFRVEGISSSFEKQAGFSSTITTLAIPLTLVAPPSAIRGQGVSYLIDYRNQSQQDYFNLRLKLKYPDGFKFSSAIPQPTSGQDIWDLALLKQGDGSRITIQGTLDGNEREVKSVFLTLQKKITTPSGDVYVDFEKTEASSIISSPYLSVKLKVNGSTSYTAHLNDDLRYTIDFSNSSLVDISGLTLSVKLEGSMYDLGSVRSNAFFDSRTTTLTWDQSIISDLAFLRPGQSGKAEFSVKIKNSFSGVSAAGSAVKAIARLETPNIPPDLNAELLSANDQLSTRISTVPVFNQEVIINDFQFGAAGPFPPKVDSKTVFTIHWTLVNPSSDVSPAKITSTLAPGVRWENIVRTGDGQPTPTYNSRTNTVTWDLGNLPGGAGVNSPKYEAFFQISITPSLNQIGQIVPLLKSSRFDGVDIYTKEKIARTVADASTSNIADSNVNGIVQPK